MLATVLARGPQQAGDVARLLGVSRSTLSRTVRAAGPRIVTRGTARRTTYGLRRTLRGSDSPLPLYRVDAQGELHRIGELDPVSPSGIAVRWEDAAAFEWPLEPMMRDGWFDGLPYFMQDMRAQGFLGRHFARNLAAMHPLSEDPRDWSDDDVLYALSLAGADTPGNLLLGETAARRWLDVVARTRLADPVTSADPRQHDLRLSEQADDAMRTPQVGSSAGGEFPKFAGHRTSAEGDLPTLVKFSGNDGSPGSQRWADLLVCESLAALTLAQELGVPSAPGRISTAAGRTFLELDRFDRHGPLGRSAVLSWFAINHGLVGSTDDWPTATKSLVQRDWLSVDDWHRIRKLWLFGRLIANTDMHDGNLAFVPSAESRPGRHGFALAPVYDMLPMAYAPGRGVEPPVIDYRPRLPLPEERDDWAAAARAAIRFWSACVDDQRITSPFRTICETNARRLSAVLG
ncbi:MAG: type II toxin-antitoxin system HipA family toxin YjjJ [Burkholderiaceae bacterium]